MRLQLPHLWETEMHIFLYEHCCSCAYQSRSEKSKIYKYIFNINFIFVVTTNDT